MTRHSLIVSAAILACAVLNGALPARGAEIVVYGFEGSVEGWQIPDWAKTSNDYVAKELSVSQENVQEGSHALAVQAAFPGGRWTGAYIEREVEVTDWTPFGRLSVDVLIPAYAPEGLEGRIILSVGPKWEWTEMNRSVPLVPGAWTTLTVNLRPGSMDWKFFPDDAFRQAVHRVGVRIESNKKPAYAGPVFIDNVRMAE